MTVLIAIVDGPLPAAEPGTTPDGCGAVVSFDGIVRGTEEGEPIAALEYEVYEPMARRVLEQLARAAIDRFAVTAVQVRHSRGRVPVGACSFRLVVAAPHRQQALAAMAAFIDQMKRDAPIWKRAV